MTRRSDHAPPRPSRTKVVPRDVVPTGADAMQDRGTLVATRDHEHIRAWARRHRAEPATGVATASGAASLDVHDGGASIRLNFPAAAPFRPIEWDEWFAVFDRDRLVFVYEPPQAQESGAFGRHGDSYYRLLPATDWAGPIR